MTVRSTTESADLDGLWASPLQTAIESGDADMVRQLVRQGVDIRTPADYPYNPDYPAPIVIAIEARQPEIVELLLSEGCFVGEQWAVIDDAFQMALDLRGKPRWPILEALIKDLASRPDLELPPASGSVLKAAKALASRAKKAEDRALSDAVAQVKGRFDQLKSESDQIENACLERRYDEVFEQLAAASPSLRKKLLGVVAIESCGGHYGFSEWLIELGAAAYVSDEVGMTPLMHSARHGSSYITRPLVNSGRAALSAKDAEGRSALEHLQQRGEHPFSHVMEMDLTYPHGRSMDRGVTPVPLSACSSFVQRAAELTRECRVPELLAHLSSVSRKSDDWKLAAGAAVLEDCKNDCLTLLQYCLNEGADLTMRNDMGSTVLHDACEVYHMPLALLQQMVQGGADVTAIDDYQKRTVLEVVQRKKGWPPGHECRTYIESLFEAGEE